ncbi:uncharacterized protein LACBIDRAFT_329471 [Laccaria bicolor S238N-H82]|uniref:Predicted protein n=1 Tax=Laccaria bicolor (strain S238N-H82 / ATCC MYA-4686) TaxID=486041 RepID=B0DI44_LACBS|nr:uncharacterized protein LACBIDRAFT_329471 [Laccaria bicolor S238N-H82]EDR05845.1 predicted protein [Laccaria bicolor S238N-H82]|eukprot:XP_001883521.1 predicted protein [Laccaria bicolor S238N-H82]
MPAGIFAGKDCDFFCKSRSEVVGSIVSCELVKSRMLENNVKNNFNVAEELTARRATVIHRILMGLNSIWRLERTTKDGWLGAWFRTYLHSVVIASIHRNDVSNKRGRTCASHRRHRSYFHKQDIDVLSREQQIEDYDDGHDTQWFGQSNLLRPHRRELLISDLSIRLPEKRSSLFKTDRPTQFCPMVSHRQLQIQCSKLHRRAVLLSVEWKKLVCAISMPVLRVLPAAEAHGNLLLQRPIVQIGHHLPSRGWLWISLKMMTTSRPVEATGENALASMVSNLQEPEGAGRAAALNLGSCRAATRGWQGTLSATTSCATCGHSFEGTEEQWCFWTPITITIPNSNNPRNPASYILI